MRSRKRSEVNYWMSYSDLMSAMLMAFVLLITIVILDYREDLAEKQKQIDAVTNVKNDIIAALAAEFEGSNVKIEVDRQTGAIRFPGSILYEYNSSDISPTGKQFLEEFVPKYFSIILQEKYKDEISNIIIEGHTDKDGSYIYNLNLSQNRAFSVVKTIYGSDFPSFPEKELSQQYVTANGRSYTVPILKEDGSYSPENSRRVEFLFRLKEEERMEEIQKLVNEQ
ncbi:flagellar motor protein MotB [Chungangia koreensis]|uniref:Flagellar motor protein MotB n=1 Tax=Chungangia koreensis TaxID=752657 RepID=A0ABV8X0H9_9LACT